MTRVTSHPPLARQPISCYYYVCNLSYFDVVLCPSSSQIHYNLRTFSFSSRVVNMWNSLPDLVVDADTVNTFKRRLDKHWLTKMFFTIFILS